MQGLSRFFVTGDKCKIKSMSPVTHLRDMILSLISRHKQGSQFGYSFVWEMVENAGIL